MVRLKSRYIVCEILIDKNETKTNIRTGDVYNELRSTLQDLHGDYAVASSMSTPSMQVLFLTETSNIIAIIRVRRGLHQLVQSAMVFVHKIGKLKASIRTLHLAGTIRSAKRFLIHHHKSKLTSLIQETKNEEERQAIQNAIVRSNEECSRNIQLYFS